MPDLLTTLPDIIVCWIVGYLLYDPDTLASLSETCRSMQRSCQIPALLSRLLYTAGASIPAPDHQIPHLTQVITKIVHIGNGSRHSSCDIGIAAPKLCSWITPELALGLYDRIVHSEALPGRVQVDLLQQLLDHALPGPVFPAIFSIPDLNVFNVDLAHFISNYPLPERSPLDCPPVIIRAVQRFVSGRASTTTSSSIPASSTDITHLNCIERIRSRYPPPFNQVYPWNFQLADYLLSQRSVRPYLTQPRVVLALLRYGIRFDIMSIGRLVNFHLDTISRILPFTYSAKRPGLTPSQTIGFRLFSNSNRQVEFMQQFHIFKQLCRDQFLLKSIFLNHIAYILQMAPSDQLPDVLHDPLIRFIIRTYPHLFLLKLPFLDHYLPTQQVNAIFQSSILSIVQDDPELLFSHIRCLIRSGNITAVSRLLSLHCIDEYISSCKDRLTDPDPDRGSVWWKFFSSSKNRLKHLDRSSASYWFFHELLPDPLFPQLLNSVSEGKIFPSRYHPDDFLIIVYLLQYHGPANRDDTNYYQLPQQVLHYVFTNGRWRELSCLYSCSYFWDRVQFSFLSLLSYVREHGSHDMLKKLGDISYFAHMYLSHIYRSRFRRNRTRDKIIQYIPRFYRMQYPVLPESLRIARDLNGSQVIRSG